MKHLSVGMYTFAWAVAQPCFVLVAGSSSALPPTCFCVCSTLVLSPWVSIRLRVKRSSACLDPPREFSTWLVAVRHPAQTQPTVNRCNLCLSRTDRQVPLLSFTGPFTGLTDPYVAMAVKWHCWCPLHNQYRQSMVDATLPGPVPSTL